MEKVIVRRDIAHGCAIMRKADISVPVDHTAQRHAPHLEQVDLLPVCLRDGMIGIRQANKWDPFVPPVLFKCRRGIGAYGEDLRITSDKSLIVISQARQLRATVRSHEPAQEGKHNRLAPAIIRKAHTVAVHIH